MISINRQQATYRRFSGGECHVNIQSIKLTSHTQVVAKLCNAADIMQLLLTIDAIKQAAPSTQIQLHLPYFPYARQDRVCHPGDAFSLQVMANLINQLDCQQVIVDDPHSVVLAQLVRHLQIRTLTDLMITTPLAQKIQQQQLTLVAPDAGSKHKVEQLANTLNVPALYCQKQRDPQTGRIIKTIAPDNIAATDYIIIDDICDGGGTFIPLIQKLKAAGAQRCFLYVTHGIFSKGVEGLLTHFDHLYCYYHFLNPNRQKNQSITLLGEDNDY